MPDVVAHTVTSTCDLSTWRTEKQEDCQAIQGYMERHYYYISSQRQRISVSFKPAWSIQLTEVRESYIVKPRLKTTMKVKQKGEKEKKKIVLIIKLLKDTDSYRKSIIEYFKCQIDHLYLLVIKVVSQFPCVIQNNKSLCVCLLFCTHEVYICNTCNT